MDRSPAVHYWTLHFIKCGLSTTYPHTNKISRRDMPITREMDSGRRKVQCNAVRWVIYTYSFVYSQIDTLYNFYLLTDLQDCGEGHRSQTISIPIGRLATCAISKSLLRLWTISKCRSDHERRKRDALPRRGYCGKKDSAWSQNVLGEMDGISKKVSFIYMYKLITIYSVSVHTCSMNMLINKY